MLGADAVGVHTSERSYFPNIDGDESCVHDVICIGVVRNGVGLCFLMSRVSVYVKGTTVYASSGATDNATMTTLYWRRRCNGKGPHHGGRKTDLIIINGNPDAYSYVDQILRPFLYLWTLLSIPLYECL